MVAHLPVLSAPARKLLLALCLVLGVVLLAAASRDAATLGAGFGLPAPLWGLLALGGGLLLWNRRRGTRADDWEAPTLEVRARTGLSPRCGLALVEADGQSFLVVHGEGFATVHGMVAPGGARAAVSRELMQ